MYNLIAAIVCVALICGTAITITVLILNCKRTKPTVQTPVSQITRNPEPEESENSETDETNTLLTAASMDTVIKAVNELMGVVEPEEGDK